jgi:hypothetical protein
MLDGYEKDLNGVVFQKNPQPIEYNYDYLKTSGDSSVLGEHMAYLRLAYIIGSIGFVPKSIVDVGYGIGDFVAAASELIPECYANDVTQDWPLPESVIFTDDIFNQYYEVVTFFDSLEHFEDIYVLDKLNCSYVCVSIPDCHYFDDEWFKNWKHRKPNEHRWHFNKDSLISFMNSQGYDLINSCNIEDIIRKNNFEYSNILTGIFKKRTAAE